MMPSIMLDAVQDDEDDPGSEMGQPLAMPEPEPEREPEPSVRAPRPQIGTQSLSAPKTTLKLHGSVRSVVAVEY